MSDITEGKEGAASFVSKGDLVKLHQAGSSDTEVLIDATVSSAAGSRVNITYEPATLNNLKADKPLMLEYSEDELTYLVRASLRSLSGNELELSVVGEPYVKNIRSNKRVLTMFSAMYTTGYNNLAKVNQRELFCMDLSVVGARLLVDRPLRLGEQVNFDMSSRLNIPQGIISSKVVRSCGSSEVGETFTLDDTQPLNRFTCESGVVFDNLTSEQKYALEDYISSQEL